MKNAILGALGALLTASLACSIFVGGPSYPESTIPVSTAAVLSLQDQVEQALKAGAESGEVTLQLSEDQLTSFLVAKSAEQTDPVLTDPKVMLRDGEMKIFGKATSGILVANVSISVLASVDDKGQAQFEISQTDFGPLAAPQAFNDALAAFLREAFTGWLGPVATGFRLENIAIGDGIMTITGRVK